MRLAQPDDLVLFISPDRKRFIVRLVPGGALHTHRGVVQHDDVLGQPLGRFVISHNDARFTVLRPSMEEVLMSLPRESQIVYPKDIGYLLLKLSIMPGTTVIEAGSGSGILTTALARYVTPGGHVYSYDVRPDMIARARDNIDRAGLTASVTFHEQSIEAGFAETGVDAVFLDVREPWRYLAQVHDALGNGGFFGSLVPTINQVVDLVHGLTRQAFTDVEVSELMLRQYKAVPERIRPLDRLTAHTGFLLFARRSRLAARPTDEEALGEDYQTPVEDTDDAAPVEDTDAAPVEGVHDDALVEDVDDEAPVDGAGSAAP